MTKLIIPCLLLAFVFPALASAADNTHFQGLINAGNFLGGGSASLSHVSVYDHSDTNLTLSPELQYFIIDRLAIGGTAGFFHEFGDFGHTDVAFGPSATYYFALLGDRTALYGSGAFSFGHNSDESGRGTTYVTSSLGAGLDYFLTPSVAIGPRLSWSHVFENGTYPSENDLALSANFRVFF